MQFSENWKTFSQYFFLHFLNLDLIFNIFKKKDDSQSLCIFEHTDSEKRG